MYGIAAADADVVVVVVVVVAAAVACALQQSLYMSGRICSPSPFPFCPTKFHAFSRLT